MTFHHYNEQDLAKDLRRLPERLRTAFAAATAVRLMPAYAGFSRKTGRGDPAKLAAIIERLWRDLEGDKMSADQVRENIDLCTTLTPQEDEGPWVLEQAAAEDASAALAYALRCRQSGDSQEAAWAARRAYEAIDHFVIAQEGIDTNRPGAEERVISHPLVQAELARQRRDLEELLSVSEAATADLLTRLKHRASTEAESFFHVRQ